MVPRPEGDLLDPCPMTFFYEVRSIRFWFVEPTVGVLCTSPKLFYRMGEVVCILICRWAFWLAKEELAPVCLATLFLFRTEFRDLVSFFEGGTTKDFLFLAIAPLPVSLVDWFLLNAVDGCFTMTAVAVRDLLDLSMRWLFFWGCVIWTVMGPISFFWSKNYALTVPTASLLRCFLYLTAAPWSLAPMNPSTFFEGAGFSSILLPFSGEFCCFLPTLSWGNCLDLFVWVRKGFWTLWVGNGVKESPRMAEIRMDLWV